MIIIVGSLSSQDLTTLQRVNQVPGRLSGKKLTWEVYSLSRGGFN